MGFLQQDTNNIVLDAVLTSLGRQRLSQNTGAFQVAFFSLGDDEIDYNVIKRFGRAVGREKIEKNTPVFEALTNGNIAMNSILVTLSDPNLTALATIGTGNKSSITIENSSQQTPTTDNVTVTITGANNSEIPIELQDTILVVSVDDRFITIPGQTKARTVGHTAYYNIVTAGADNPTTRTFNLRVTSKSLTNADFTTFNNGTSTQITTAIRMQGLNSGLSDTLPVTIHKNNA